MWCSMEVGRQVCGFQPMIFVNILVGRLYVIWRKRCRAIRRMVRRAHCKMRFQGDGSRTRCRIGRLQKSVRGCPIGG